MISEMLEQLIKVQQTFLDVAAKVMGEGAKTLPQADFALTPEHLSVPKSAAPPTRPKAVPRLGPKPNELDGRVLALLASRPGTSVAEIEREIGEVGRSRLEWSLRRLLANGQAVKSGNTCGARYSATITGPSSSLREAG